MGDVRLRLLVAAVAALLVVPACGSSAVVTGPFGTSAPQPPAISKVLWVGDLTTGDLSQFQDGPWNNVGGTAPTVVEAPERRGASAVELTIPGSSSASDGICCGSRNELLPKFRDLVSGDDLYFRFSTFLAPGFPVDADWQVITQFKQNFDGSPPLTLNVEQGQYRVEGGYGHPDGSRQFIVNIGPAGTGSWVDWVMHVKFSADPAVGYVEVWKDGAIVLPRYFPPGGTMYPGPDGVDSSYVKTGLYRDPSIAVPGTLYLDNWVIGTP